MAKVKEFVKIEDIKVGERFRVDYGEVESLAVSINRYGLFHPIIIDRAMNLVAGERRLKAHIKLGMGEIEVKYLDETDDLTKREIEIEENVKRKDFTWQEEVKAKKALDEIKRKLYGTSLPGHGGGWSLDQTAKYLGESTGTVSQDIKLAKALEEYPELAKERNKATAFKRYQRMKEDALTTELAKRVEVKVSKKCLVNGDSRVELAKLKDESVDMVLTDPPFGKDLEMKEREDGTKKPYEDDEFSVMNTIDTVLKECYRVLKKDRVCLVFFDITKIDVVKKVAKEAGFQVCETPLVFNKTGGPGPLPNESYYGMSYEMILHCQKGFRVLNKKGDPNVITEKRVPPQFKIHPTQKPPRLLRYLINQHTQPGELVVDPFAGSGSTITEALVNKRQAWGCEIKKEFYSAALLELEKLMEAE